MNPSPLARAVNWSDVSEKVRTRPWAAAIVESLAEAFDRFAGVWPGDPPVLQSEWTHHYYCDDDAAKLRFDFAKPHEHVCTQCGRVYRGEPWDGAWRTMVHGSHVGQCERAAILSRLRPDEPKYAATLKKIVHFYAEHYAGYPVHGVRAGKGKVMPQCLDESILLLSLNRYLQWAGIDGGQVVRDKLFAPAVDLLRPQVERIHNIHAWMMSAIAASAQQLGDRKLLDWTIQSEFGFANQLAKGTNADGFWYEGSITYHYYTFNALASHAMTAGEMGVNLFDQPRFAAMLSAPLALAYPSGDLPAHNDCWPGVRVAGPLYELGAWAWPGESFGKDIGWIAPLEADRSTLAWTSSTSQLQAKKTGLPRASVLALLFGPAEVAEAKPPRRTSRLFKASGMAILENDAVRVCIRSGQDGGSHDHRDRLNVDVSAGGAVISPDLGTSGYGAAITYAWYKTPAAHNTVAINGQRQAASEGVIESFNDTAVLARADQAYPGVRMSRRIDLTANGWRDELRVECDESSRVDYFFHALGIVKTALPLQPGQLGEGGGYAWPRDMRTASTDAEFTIDWQTPAGRLRAVFAGEPGTQIFLSQADPNPAGADLGVLTVRRQSKATTFRATFSFER